MINYDRRYNLILKDMVEAKCHHKYVYKEYGNIHFEECRKCGRIKIT